MCECRTPDVPSFSALRKKQAQLTAEVNIKTTRHVSAFGNEFYMNHPAELLALDWANPLVREFIQVYPEITDNISEFMQADKWTKEVSLNDLSPMWADWKNAGHKHFYVKELAQLKNGNFVILIRWIIFKKEEYAEVYNVVHYPASATFVIHTGEIVRVKATDLKYNFIDLCETGHVFKFPASSPDWGRPVFSIQIIPWSDNVSGNVAQEYFVRFCSTSPYTSSGKQFEALAEDLQPNKYHEAYDCKLEQEIIFRIFAHVLPADNPQQAESASNAGVHSNYWCRYDSAGGMSTERETDDGYRALFKPGISRTPAQTIRTIKRQIWAACSGVQESVDNLPTATGVKDKTALLWIEKVIIKARETQKERFSTDLRLKDKKLTGEARRKVKTRIKDLIQWELYNWVISNLATVMRSLDPHQDSPCEILHSILLGDDKYIWHETNTKWDKAKGEIFAIQLQSSSTNGLNMASNALIRKHFKVVQQLGIFHLHDDLCSSNLFDLWRASGELGALLWFPEIRNLEQYLADLQICIDNVLDIWALIDPARIVTKFKLHIFECWNKIFRLCSILSNHQAPSHDISVTLAGMERFKHQVSGGWWKPPGSPEYVQAGTKITSFLDQNKELQRRLGWMDKSKPKPGKFLGTSVTFSNTDSLESRQKAISASWREIIGPHWSAGIDAHGAGKVWTTCKYVISQAGDVCTKLSWVFFKSTDTDIISAGRITNILIPLVSSTQHGDAVDILFHFNAQHDCKNLKCRAVDGAENIVQERGPTGRTQAAVQHVDTNIYFINMHALHNAHLLRETLPRNLTAPIPYFTDRDAKHREFAALLRVSGPAKRATALKKAKETREKKQRAKEGGGLAPISEVDEDPDETED
ncbi:hypothetical protein B0H17DRAFT_1161670 [Mycena rosella]|uniref:Uncharacterized protein n=1 Tax=Mycena rosella TaxID=1033263 RepID=A0AAD7D1Q9_MYCRO|nr:hypothetical protein B0H17DRAFT_1161670 [Mycena rosella]